MCWTQIFFYLHGHLERGVFNIVVISYDDFSCRSDDPHEDSENQKENDRFTR